MNICPNCNHELVNIIYGYPKPELIDMARKEEVALGGCVIMPDHFRFYCYGCHESFN